MNLHRSVPKIGVALIVATLSAATLSPTSAGAAAPAASAKKNTPYLLGSSGYASRAVRGDLPVGSDQSAFAVVACTNKAGLSRTNTKAAVDLGAGMKLNNVSTHAWTTKKGSTVSSWGKHSIEQVVLADTPLGSLSLDGVTSTSHAWHDANGFHSTTTSDLAGIVLKPVVGPAQHLNIPLPGQTLTIPGVATIALGDGTDAANAHGAFGSIDAIRLHVIPTNTVIFLAHSRARIQDGIVSALFRGSAYATKADVLEGVVTSGRTPNQPTPCLGTGGKTASKQLVDADVSPGVVAKAPSATTRAGLNKSGHPYITNSAKVGRINLGGGLVITAVVGKVHIEKVGRHYVKNTHGTTLGRITLNGQTQTIPDTGTLEIPGVAKIESNVTTHGRNRIGVTALRVTLLDGRVAVINIGNARATLVPTGM